MLTYADIRGAYMDGCRSAHETVASILLDTPTDTPQPVLDKAREIVTHQGLNACTIDMLADCIAENA